MKALVLLYESVKQALLFLRLQPVRTALSLSSVSVGVFCIVAVFTLVDALESNVRKSLSFMGNGLIYVQKWPWSFESDYPWWKFVQRASIQERDFKFLEEKVTSKEAIAIFAMKSNQHITSNVLSFHDAYVLGMSYQYNLVSDIRIQTGRYFSFSEIEHQQRVCLLGYELAQSLNINNISENSKVKLKGQFFRVIGVLKKQGSNVLGGPSVDQSMYIPFQLFQKYYGTGKQGSEPTIAVKALSLDYNQQILEEELVRCMRFRRSLRIFEEADFALNRPELIARLLSSTFQIIHIAGWFIGGFSLIVGGFSIANMMYVSVKERTPQIGIQKALGAPTYFIRNQFMFESVTISLLGGLTGMAFVMLITQWPQSFLELQFKITHATMGLLISLTLGIISGVFPAMKASKLDPIIAMHKNFH